MHVVRTIAAAVAATLICAPSRGALAPGLTGTLDVSQPGSLTAAHFAAKSAAKQVVGDTVGGHDERRSAYVVKPGGLLSFQMRVNPHMPITLEFEEMYGRDALVRGYTVMIDGVPVYFRTWRACGAGPVHYFVQVPPRSAALIDVRLINRGEAPFAISRVWAFSDFGRYFVTNRLAVPYAIAPLVSPSFRNLKVDLAAVTSIKRSIGTHANAGPAFTVAIAYASFGRDEVKRRIEYVLDLAKRAAMPVQIEFDTWWAQTPGGMDGQGGYWSDVRYQQVVYNATRKRYQLSVPNQWSSTPWLTTNDPVLNAYKQRRLSLAAADFRDAVDRMDARSLVLAINLDNEPVYWANGNAGLGEDLLQADFNPSTIDAAKSDGVILDPADGLSFAERKWLLSNLVRYNGMVADALARGLRGETSHANDDLLRNNIYTQAMVGAPDIQYPMLSASYPFWESAAPLHARVGGEWNGGSLFEIQAIQRQLALGRNAGTNAECGNKAANMQGVQTGYAMGQRFVALYNYPLDKMDVATTDIRDVRKPLKAFVYQPVVREERFVDGSWKARAVETAGLRSGVIGNTAAIAIWPAFTYRPGFITWALKSPKGPWTSLSLELDGRAFSYGKKDPAVNVRVLAGPSRDPTAMREMAVLHDRSFTGADRVDLSPAAHGLTTVYVRIEMRAPTIPPSVLSWCSIYQARFTTGWQERYLSGVAQDESLATLRKQNLLVSWRRDAEMAIAELRMHRLNTAQASAAYGHGAYADAYHIANRALYTLEATAKRMPAFAPTPSDAKVTGAFHSLTSYGEIALNTTDGLVIVPAGDDTIVTLNGAAAPLNRLQNGDDVSVERDAIGTATRIEAKNEMLEGTVKVFGQVTPFDMPSVTLETGRTVTLNMDAVVHTPEMNLPIKSIALGTVDVKPGDAVRVRVGALGRGFELWAQRPKQ